MFRLKFEQLTNLINQIN